jgi:hypothetical protein
MSTTSAVKISPVLYKKIPDWYSTSPQMACKWYLVGQYFEAFVISFVQHWILYQAIYKLTINTYIYCFLSDWLLSDLTIHKAQKMHTLSRFEPKWKLKQEGWNLCGWLAIMSSMTAESFWPNGPFLLVWPKTFRNCSSSSAYKVCIVVLFTRKSLNIGPSFFEDIFTSGDAVFHGLSASVIKYLDTLQF